MAAPPRALLLCALALLTSGCRQLADTLFVMDVETDEICKTERSLEFPAVPAGTRTLTQSIQFPLGQMGKDLPDKQLTAELRLRLFELNVTGGGADVRGIEYAKVSLRRLGSTEIIRTLLEYQRPEQVFSSTQLTLRGVEAVTVPQLAREDEVELIFEATGDLPTQPWTADVQACGGFSAQAHYFDLIF